MYFRGKGRGPDRGRGRGRGMTISPSLQEKFTKLSQQVSQGASSSSADPVSIGKEKTIKDILVGNDEPDFIVKDNQECIMILDHEDEKWIRDPSYLGNKYFEENFGAPIKAGKTQTYYEQILLETGSINVRHKKANNIHEKEHLYSQVHILRVIKCADWGLDPNRVRDLKNSYYHTQYNYWDYVDAWHYCFLYQNPSRKHSWFFYWDAEFKKTDWEMPNWFYAWWKKFGLLFKCMPNSLQKLADDYAKYHPKFQGSQIIEGQALLWFSVDYLVPWIWAWTYSCMQDELGLDCLVRNYHCKWWKKFPLDEKVPHIKQDILLLEKQSILEKAEKAKSDAFLKAALKEPMNPITSVRDRIAKENPGLSRQELKLKLVQEVLASSFPDDPMEEDKNDKGKDIVDDSEDVKSMDHSEADKSIMAWWEKQKNDNMFLEYDTQH